MEKMKSGHVSKKTSTSTKSTIRKIKEAAPSTLTKKRHRGCNSPIGIDFFHRSDDSDDEAGGTRRSKRARVVDINRPLVIIRPRDNLISKLGVSEDELPALRAVLADDKPLLDEVTPQDDTPAVVFTPMVKESKPSSDHKKNKKTHPKPKTTHRQRPIIEAPAYTDYDASEEDAAFVNELNSKAARKQKKAISALACCISVPLFETMIAILERELEISKQFSITRVKCNRQRKQLLQCIASAEDALQSKQLVTSPSPNTVEAGSKYSVVMQNSFSLEELRELVSRDRALLVLSQALRQSHLIRGETTSNNTTSSKSSAAVTAPVKLTPTEQSSLNAVYEYWLGIRSAATTSLLRCYHTFIMDWQQSARAPIPEDLSISQLEHAYEILGKVRYGLDRSRLIMDRVRKRERVKKELTRLEESALNSVSDESEVEDNTSQYTHSFLTSTTKAIKSRLKRKLGAAKISHAMRASPLVSDGPPPVKRPRGRPRKNPPPPPPPSPPPVVAIKDITPPASPDVVKPPARLATKKYATTLPGQTSAPSSRKSVPTCSLQRPLSCQKKTR